MSVSTKSWLAGLLPETAREKVLVLGRAEVLRCLENVDVVDVVRDAIVEHEHGRSLLPSEAYLAWTNGRGAYTRSIGMPGIIGQDGVPAHGMKIINASVSNPEVGLERAGGVGLCFDKETARISAVLEVGVLSAVRTAAVTAVAMDAVGYRKPTTIAVVGCGAQARVHLGLLLSRHPSVRAVTLHDRNPEAAARLATELGARYPAAEFGAATSVPDAMAGADVVLLLTTADEGYVVRDWIPAGALVVNVSLGDLTDDVFISCAGLYVDDIGLIAENPRRPLGRLLAEGRVHPRPSDGSPAITATIGGLLVTRRVPERPVDGYAVVNPFGLGVLDVALFATVERQAHATGIGQWLTLI